MPTFFEELQSRSLVKQITDPGLEKDLQARSLTLYCGFDPTSDSLHLGSLLPLLALRRFQQAGHRPIAVVGGATGMIGDPSGKSQERSLMSEDQLAQNVVGIRRIIEKFLDFGGKYAASVVNNADFYRGMSTIQFLRDVGKHFTINYMMTKESVRTRLEDREHGISYTEFSYMLLQAYDFYRLNHEHGCSLQIGGSDQWGNITAGCELIRRMAAAVNRPAPHVYGLTFPLITQADGSKFGKTETGAIWLDAQKTSPYHFYQYLVRTADADVIGWLKYLSFFSLDEIRELEQQTLQAPEKREAQRALARHLTELVHGKQELERAEKATEAFFGTQIHTLDRRLLLDVFADAPTSRIASARLDTGLGLMELLAETGLCSSKGAARKDLEAGGIYLNNERVTDAQTRITSTSLLHGQYVVLRKGKKNYHLVSFE